MAARLQLKILQPYATFAQENEVIRIVAETAQGAFGILPNRLDCAAVLTAGIFCYQCADGEEVYIAVDQGVLVIKVQAHMTDAGYPSLMRPFLIYADQNLYLYDLLWSLFPDPPWTDQPSVAGQKILMLFSTTVP